MQTCTCKCMQPIAYSHTHNTHILAAHTQSMQYDYPQTYFVCLFAMQEFHIFGINICLNPPKSGNLSLMLR